MFNLAACLPETKTHTGFVLHCIQVFQNQHTDLKNAFIALIGFFLTVVTTIAKRSRGVDQEWAWWSLPRKTVMWSKSLTKAPRYESQVTEVDVCLMSAVKSQSAVNMWSKQTFPGMH